MRISDWSSDVCSSDLDLTIVLLATVPLQDLKQIRELTDAAGVALVDCGVTGGQTVRQNGLVCLVGADEVAFARARPVLGGFANSVELMGGPNAAMAAKIVRNDLLFGCLPSWEGCR